MNLPFFISFSFLNTLLVSSNIKLSPDIHTSRTDAPSTHFSIISTRTPVKEINITYMLEVMCYKKHGFIIVLPAYILFTTALKNI